MSNKNEKVISSLILFIINKYLFKEIRKSNIYSLKIIVIGER